MSVSRRRFLSAVSMLALLAVPSGKAAAGWNGCAGGWCDLASAPATPVPTWSRIQGVSDSSGSGTTKNVSFGSAITAGSVVLGGVLLLSPAVLVSVTDDKSNAYTVVNSDGVYQASLTVAGFRSNAPITNSPQTLTFTFQSSGLCWTVMDEFSPGVLLTGISLDGSQLFVATPSTIPAGATPVYRSLQANDLQYAAVFSTASITAGAGWTAASGSGSQVFSEWKQVTSPGNSNSASWSTSGQAWCSTFAIAPSPRTSWEVRQQAILRSSGSLTSGSVTFPKTIASGAIIIGAIAVGTGGGNLADITGITDDQGNSYTFVSQTIDRAIFWSNGAVTNGPITLTCNTSVSESFIGFLVAEFTPPVGKTIFAVDGQDASGGGSGPPFNSGSITPTQNGDLIYTFMDLAAGIDVVSNGFSSLNGQGATWNDSYLVQGTAAAVASQYTGSSGSSNALPIAAFKAS